MLDACLILDHCSYDICNFVAFGRGFPPHNKRVEDIMLMGRIREDMNRTEKNVQDRRGYCYEVEIKSRFQDRKHSLRSDAVLCCAL